MRKYSIVDGVNNAAITENALLVYMYDTIKETLLSKIENESTKAEITNIIDNEVSNIWENLSNDEKKEYEKFLLAIAQEKENENRLKKEKEKVEEILECANKNKYQLEVIKYVIKNGFLIVHADIEPNETEKKKNRLIINFPSKYLSMDREEIIKDLKKHNR